MSLLDDVSIVVTPNGYKAGELYAVVPVPTEGAEEIVNGDFATDSDWSKGTGWTISGGSALRSGASSNSSIEQTISIVSGKTYLLSYDRTYISGGGTTNLFSDFVTDGVSITIGNLTSTIQETVKVTAQFTPTYTGTLNIRLFGISTFNGTMDNVSVKEVIIASADMDVTRATAATRVDEAGLVNYAEIIGSELITDGNFPTPNANWTIQGGAATTWVINNNIATRTGSTNWGLYQNITRTVGSLYKITFNVLTYTSGNLQVRLGDGATNNVTNTGSKTLYLIWDGSTDKFAFEGSFIGSIENVSVKEATRDNVPRIDYSGGGCPHILAEPQRTNLVTDSVDIDTYFTNQVDATVTNDYGTSPTGENNSTRVQWADSTSFIYRAESVATDTSASIFVKGISGETVMFGFGGNVTTGTVYTFDGSWQRIIFTGSTGTTIFLSSYGGATATDFEVFGLQLEVGSFPTSYIPTSGSTVTRNQDQFTRDGIGSLINSEEGVLFLEIARNSNEGAVGGIQINDGSDNNNLRLFFNQSNTISVITRVGGSNNVIKTAQSITSSTAMNKFALMWKLNDYKLYYNGAELWSDTSASVYPTGTLNNLEFKNQNTPFEGKVKQLQVFKTALTDSELATLTTI